MKNFLTDVESFLGKLNNLRDRVLFIFIKQYWPKFITPNHLSYLRLGIGLVLCVLLFVFKIENKSLIVSLFFIGIISDLLDGSLARATNQITEFGAMLDPTADRVLIFPIAIYSLLPIHPELIVYLLVTEVINTLFSIYYNAREIYLESNIFGKTKMVLLSLVFLATLFFFPHNPGALFIGILWLTIPVSFLSIYSKILDLQKSHAKQ